MEHICLIAEKTYMAEKLEESNIVHKWQDTNLKTPKLTKGRIAKMYLNSCSEI